jgi:hypothetical protein
MIARMALNELAKFLKKEKLEWYLRYSILYVELEDQSEIILLFSQKNIILTQVNVYLTEYGYTTPLKDIRHKKMRSKELSDGYN